MQLQRVCACIGAMLVGVGMLGDAAQAGPAVSTRQDGGLEIAGRTVQCGNVRTRLDRNLPGLGAAAPRRASADPQSDAPAAPARHRPTVRLLSRVRPSPRRRQRAAGGLLGRRSRRARGLARRGRLEAGVRFVRRHAGDADASFGRAPLPQSRHVLRAATATVQREVASQGDVSFKVPQPRAPDLRGRAQRWCATASRTSAMVEKFAELCVTVRS